MVEYIDQQIGNLSWQVAAKTSDITAPDCCGDNIISGSRTDISIWQFVDDDPGAYDQLPIAELTSEKIPDRACRVHLIGNIAFTALINGTVYLHELNHDPRPNLRQLSETKNLHPDYKCEDMLFCAQTNSVLSCANDGSIATFNIEHPKKINRFELSKSSLKCMDIINPNEIICGTLSGALKHFDLRSQECVGTFANQSLSALICLQRNPNVNHLATGGNDQGSIIIYDLRNTSSALAQISAHNSAITNVKYRPRNPNILYSSSCDGELFKWNLSTEFTANQVPRKVESIGCTSEPLSIISFDINHLGDLIYTTDHGAIFYRKINDIVP